MDDAKHYHTDEDPNLAEACDPLSQTTEAPPDADGEAESCVPLAEDSTDPAVSADSGTDPDSHSDTADAEDASGGADELRAELTRLREDYARAEAMREKTEREYEEFFELFPDVPVSSVPDEVWSRVREGTPLAAAFALAERRRFLQEQLAKESNARNRERSSGKVGGSASEFYSPEEVRAMSQGEVRSNFSKIINSMKKWH